MQQYRNITALIIMLALILTQISCKDNLIEPEHYGVIHGVIINEDDNSLVPNVAVTTTPATVATTSDNNGKFRIEEVQVGKYTIQSKKKGFENSGVNINVRKDRETDATIFLTVKEVDEPPHRQVDIEVTRWRNDTLNDTTHVNVDYRIENTGDAPILEYEIYFKILTESTVYYYELQGVDLKTGQVDVGEFDKFIHNEIAREVEVNGHWISSEEEPSEED